MSSESSQDKTASDSQTKLSEKQLTSAEREAIRGYILKFLIPTGALGALIGAIIGWFTPFFVNTVEREAKVTAKEEVAKAREDLFKARDDASREMAKLTREQTEFGGKIQGMSASTDIIVKEARQNANAAKDLAEEAKVLAQRLRTDAATTAAFVPGADTTARVVSNLVASGSFKQSITEKLKREILDDLAPKFGDQSSPGLIRIGDLLMRWGTQTATFENPYKVFDLTLDKDRFLETPIALISVYPNKPSNVQSGLSPTWVPAVTEIISTNKIRVSFALAQGYNFSSPNLLGPQSRDELGPKTTLEVHYLIIGKAKRP